MNLQILTKINQPLINLALKLNAKKVWITRDGRELALKDMDLNHLRNSIKFCHRNGQVEWAQWLTLELARRGEYTIELRGN